MLSSGRFRRRAAVLIAAVLDILRKTVDRRSAALAREQGKVQDTTPRPAKSAGVVTRLAISRAIARRVLEQEQEFRRATGGGRPRRTQEEELVWELSRRAEATNFGHGAESTARKANNNHRTHYFSSFCSTNC